MVVSGDIKFQHPDSTTVTLSGLDAEAAHRLTTTAHLLYPKATISQLYSSTKKNIAVENYKDNLIIVGGPVNNKCSDDFLKKYSSFVQFINGDDFYHVIFRDKTYKQTEEHDYGIIICDNNPQNRTSKDKRILLIAGCDSYGVLAASKLIDYYRDDTSKAQHQLFYSIYKNIFQKKNYAVLILCDKLGNTITNVAIIDYYIISDGGSKHISC